MMTSVASSAIGRRTRLNVDAVLVAGRGSRLCAPTRPGGEQRSAIGVGPQSVLATARRRSPGDGASSHECGPRCRVHGCLAAHEVIHGQSIPLQPMGGFDMPADTPSPFQLRKIGHVVLNVADLDASARFYTEVLGLEVSDRYPDSMVPGGMIFLRFNTDHHGIALVGGKARVPASSLNHFAFEVGTLDEVFRARAWLRERGVPLVFEGRRRAGCQVAVEFPDPDGNHLEIYWNIDQIGTNSAARPANEWRQATSLEDAAKNPVAGQRLPRSAEVL